ncbi:NAD(P)-dependent dehydrogenase (short-subunit alcohol dehydrogenase family) [Pseudonocardia sediminis]|uniref:NAD(P)-dependent dehydrogenase (Short-subunit alcohol dehydrogenase family) n=1 Tax=Pseudonocardia sediminis TaxID=1397368 RepID=A0A4Q7V4P6_PSEST|nr:SDR family oxidoreductase [Pseudonocardia sediminis]RZT88454.1 NAD(P)-dependent dehydrogenase (short-subunit alcohol dehydrogenase family) [Pseudonocardia sediminis]
MVSRHVVTGASSGIGAALAAALAAGGDEVLGLDRSDGFPPGVEPVHCDLTDPASIAAAARRIGAAGPLDGLACVAGVPGTAPAATVMAVNVVGTRALTEALLPRVRDGGSVVLLASLAGYRSPVPDADVARLVSAPDADVLAAAGDDGPEAYQLSKKIVHRYAVELAVRLLPRRVRCSSISPGPVTTPILADFRATMPSVDGAAEIVGRHGAADEVAAAAAFLLSPAASWVNGIDLRVDGGLLATRAVAAPVQ